MRLSLWALAVVLLAIPAHVLHAADAPNPDQLKKMYDDTLVQLKAAQDRKNELAKENENLKAKVDDLNKQLAAAQAQIQDLRRAVADNADRTFYLRSYHAAWQVFLERYPDLMVRWKMFLERDASGTTPYFPAFTDPAWPLEPAAQG